MEETGKNIVRSARQRLEAKRQSDGFGASPSTVNEMKRQLWNNSGSLHSSTHSPSSQRSQYRQQTNVPTRDSAPAASQSFHARDSVGGSHRSARSLSPARAGSFEAKMFQSKYYDAARAARLLEKKEKSVKSKELSRSLSQPPKQPSPRQPSPRQPSPRAPPIMQIPKKETMGGGIRAEARLPITQRTTQSMSPRPKAYDIRTSSPKSMTSYETARPTASLDTTEKEHRLSPKSPVTPARGRLATMALKRGLSRGRSPSAFIENRIRAFSQERSDVPAPAPTLPHINSSGHLGQKCSVSSQEAQGTIQSGSSFERLPTRSHTPILHSNEQPTASSVRGKRSSVAAFWNAKAAKEVTSPIVMPPSSQPQISRKSWHGEKAHAPETKPKSNSSTDLMAKLSAVDRGDPAAALAQIDSILQEESRKKSYEPILINNDDDSAAGTTVSSLTNPDYRDSQRGTVRAISGNVPNQISPNAVTTSAFRQPRPSSLKNYATSIHQKEIQKLPGSRSLQKQQPPSVYRPQERKKPALVSPVKNSGPATLNNLKTTMPEQRIPIPHSPSRASSRPHPWDDEVPQSPSIPSNNLVKEDASVFIDVDLEVSKHERKQMQHHQPKCSPSVAEDLLNESFEFGEPKVFPEQTAKVKRTATRLTPLQHENAKKISENFDAAWASMPGMAFAPPTGARSPKSGKKHRRRSQSTRSSGTVDLDASFDTPTSGSRSHNSRSFSHSGGVENGDDNGERFSIEVSLYDNASHPSQNGGRRLNDKSKTKPRGFLRSFVRRQNGKKGTTTSSTNNESHGSIGVHSGSQTSAGAQSSSTPKTPQSVPSSGAPSFSPGSHHQREFHQSTRTNNRSSQPLPRESAETTENFRTARLAQKYSRVMRLYDDE